MISNTEHRTTIIQQARIALPYTDYHLLECPDARDAITANPRVSPAKELNTPKKYMTKRLLARLEWQEEATTSEVLVSSILAPVRLASPSMFRVPCVLVLIVLMGLY